MNNKSIRTKRVIYDENVQKWPESQLKIAMVHSY